MVWYMNSPIPRAYEKLGTFVSLPTRRSTFRERKKGFMNCDDTFWLCFDFDRNKIWFGEKD